MKKDREEVIGGNFLAKWNKIYANDASLTLQGYFDYIRNDLQK